MTRVIFTCLLFGPIAAAATDPAERLTRRLDRRWCAEALDLGTEDFTRVAGPPEPGLAGRLRYWGDLRQTRHDRRAWARARGQMLVLWGEIFARESIGEDWSPVTARARRLLDERARRWLGGEVKNREQMIAAFRVLRGELTRLKSEVEVDEPTRLAADLARAVPALPADLVPRLARERALRRLLTQDLKAKGGARLGTTYALLAAGLDGDEIIALRRALRPLGFKTEVARAKVLNFVARVPLFARVIKIAAAELPAPAAPAPRPAPTPPEPRARGRGFWHRIFPPADDDHAKHLAEYGRRREAHRRDAEDRAADFARAERAWSDAVRYRANARRVVDAFLRDDEGATTRRHGIDQAVREIYDRPETPTQDIEFAVTDVIMTTGESDELRAAVRAALTLLPRLMDPDASLRDLDIEPK